jgi:predicted nuclease with TOPRIM domain
MDQEFKNQRDELIQNFIINMKRYFDLVKNNQKENKTYDECKARYEEVKTTYENTVQFLKQYDDNVIYLYNSIKDVGKKPEEINKLLISDLIPQFEKINKFLNENNKINDKIILKELTTRKKNTDDPISELEIKTPSEILILPEINCMGLCEKIFKCDLGNCKIIEEEYAKCIEPHKNKNMMLSIVSSSVFSSSLLIIIIIVIIYIRNKK